jgi:hypothetical protein
MTQSASALISSLSAGADLLCRVTPIPTGSKQNNSFFPKQVRGELMENATVDSSSGGRQSAESNALVGLRNALRERLAIIRDEESRQNADAHVARLRAVSEKIDELQAALSQPIDPRLVHYLQRRSYDKALEFLETSIAP